MLVVVRYLRVHAVGDTAVLLAWLYWDNIGFVAAIWCAAKHLERIFGTTPPKIVFTGVGLFGMFRTTPLEMLWDNGAWNRVLFGTTHPK